MKTTIYIIAILVLVVSSVLAGEITLRQVDNTADLARFIHQESQKKGSLDKFEQHLDDNNPIRVSNSEYSIPVKEIYATIIEEIIGDFDWIKGSHKVREICAYTDSKGELHRYHIIKFTSDDYKRIKTVATKKPS